MPIPCDHNRTHLLARRAGVDYVECQDCREIFEAEDLEPAPADDDENEEEPVRKPASRMR